MNIENRKRVEKEIATAVITAALALGYTFEIDNGGDDDEIIKTTTSEETLSQMFQTDEEKLYCMKDGKAVGWVFFVYGNDGWDVIADYTVNLEEMLKPAEAIADSYQ